MPEQKSNQSSKDPSDESSSTDNIHSSCGEVANDKVYSRVNSTVRCGIAMDANSIEEGNAIIDAYMALDQPKSKQT
jgi:hypothetical protein